MARAGQGGSHSSGHASSYEGLAHRAQGQAGACGRLWLGCRLSCIGHDLLRPQITRPASGHSLPCGPSCLPRCSC